MNKSTFKTVFGIARLIYRNNYKVANNTMKNCGLGDLTLPKYARSEATNIYPLSARLALFKANKAKYKEYCNIYLKQQYYGV